eukprot:TRINITY_DN16309_c0_g1_i1.p1 TRINITY_DN16309_c0_g1~~TRINITY_DN16309_c0_g1_i1.p1  ORF type:complete len:315 (+),score=116.99 TRINITY_DN16309_c0_g1_i1:137-1081(+)
MSRRGDDWGPSRIERVEEGGLAEAINAHLTDALEAVRGDPTKLVLVLDLDDTYITVRDPEATTFGSSKWLVALIDDYGDAVPGMGIMDVQDQILELCSAMLGHVPVKPCDPAMGKVVQKWKERGASVIGATARMNTCVASTLAQLRSVEAGGYDTVPFCDLAPDVAAVQEKFSSMWRPGWPGWPGVHHKDGVWYLSMANKGLFLKSYLDKGHACVFIDDSHHHLVAAQEALQYHLPYHSSIHYVGATDAMAASYCAHAAAEAMAALLADLHARQDAAFGFRNLVARKQPFLRAWVRRNVARFQELQALHATLSA